MKIKCLIFGIFTASIANSYPNDIGIEKDADVLYAEKFNDGLPNI